MNIQKEEEGCELDKSDRVRREKRGRGRQKIQTSRRLMSECASANGQQGKWDTFTWISCAVWTSSMFICLVLLLELDPLMLSPLLVSRVQILAPPHTSWHPLGASLSLGLIDRLARHSGCVYSFLILQPRKKNVSLKSPSIKSPGALVLSPLKWTASQSCFCASNCTKNTSIRTLWHHKGHCYSSQVGVSSCSLRLQELQFAVGNRRQTKG